MKIFSLKLILSKPLKLTLAFLLVSTFAIANTGEELVETKNKSDLNSKKTLPKPNPVPKKDSIVVNTNKIEASIIRGYKTSYKPTEADSIQNSNEVLSFNFIQYMIQRFKFSEEGF